MNSREKFILTMEFDASSPAPLYEFGYWVDTVRRWYREGLPCLEGISAAVPGGEGVGGFLPAKKHKCKDVEKFIKIDKALQRIEVESWFFPKFEPRVLQELKDGTSVIIDEMGIKKRIGKQNDSIPEYCDWPVKNNEDWERLKTERLNPKDKGRYPEDLEKLTEKHENRDYPLTMGMGAPIGFFGSLRYLLGEVKLFTCYHDNPELIKTIIDYLADFWIELWYPVISYIKPDCFHLWEDMCYKTGPLISPQFFRQFMLPAYKKLTGFLKENGIDVIFVDTDGNCWELIPLFIEGGVSGLYPMEVAAGMNVVEVRKAFPRLQITGGIDKRALAQNREAIDSELESKIPFMVKKGGYIPHIDHNIPPDVPFQNFLYYRRRLEELTGLR